MRLKSNITGTVYRYLVEINENGLLRYNGDTISKERIIKFKTNAADF